MYDEIYNPDFLILTAMPIEGKKVFKLIKDLKQNGYYFYGTIQKKDSISSYKVAVFVTGQGPENASAATVTAIKDLNPKKIILAGICAGFNEMNVKLGDVLLPNSVLDYSYSKTTNGNENGVETNHRRESRDLSSDLHLQATFLSQNNDYSWVKYICERPDGLDKPPVIISNNFTILGCGGKVIDTVLDEDRRWLIDKGAYGLEMESYGVLNACISSDKPCLVVKGVQDNGVNKTDLWREYSAEAAAAFSIYFIENYKDDKELYRKYRDQVDSWRNSILFKKPDPEFKYTVALAHRFTSCTRRLYDNQGLYSDVLKPNPMARKIIIHGEGGKGKTQILKSIFTSLLTEGHCPIFINLKEYSQEFRGEEITTGNNIIANIFEKSSPRLTIEETKKLSYESKVVLLIDGLNEISNFERAELLKFLKELCSKCPDIYILMTCRMSDIDETDEYWHAIVEPLDECCVKEIYDNRFGFGAFDKLNDNLKKIFTRPFFLSLSVKNGYAFNETHIGSQIFIEFFEEHSRLSQEELKVISESVIASINDNCTFNVKKFRTTLAEPVRDKLIQFSVCQEGTFDFEHDLWRDFFIAVFLSNNNDKWTPDYFDKATNFATNLESLVLTIELIDNIDIRDEFLKAVFNWSYIAALDCISQLKCSQSDIIKLNKGISNAILAAIAEKKFDSIKRTRINAELILNKHNYEEAKKIKLCSDRDKLSYYIANTDDSEDWYILWKNLFTKQKSYLITDEELEKIDSDDSIIGWTIANLLRRINLSVGQIKFLRELFKSYKKCTAKNTVRWRIVHALGGYAEKENIQLLMEALDSDLYYWVSYGAARAIVEIAAKADKELRDYVLERLITYINDEHSTPLHMQRKIYREILESAFIKDSNLDWKADFRPILDLIVEKESDQVLRDTLKERVQEFETYDY